MKFVDLLKCQLKSQTKFQSRAARTITGPTYDVSHLTFLIPCHGKHLIIEEKNPRLCLILYKVLNDHAAPGLKESSYERNVTQNIYNLRNSENDLILSKTRTEYLRRSFKYSGAMLWNVFSLAAKSADTLDCLKRETGRFCVIRVKLTVVNSIFKL